MTKKRRLGSDPLEELIQDTRAGVPEKKPPEAEEKSKTTREGLPGGWTRATFIVREELLEKIKDLAYWERLQIKEVVNDALENHVKGKRIKKRPEGR